MAIPNEIDEAGTAAFLAPLKNVQPAVLSRPRVRRRAFRTIGIAFAGLAVSGTAVAAISGWNPTVGDTGRGGEPTFSGEPIPAQVEAALGVLRKPRRVDRSPAVQGSLHGVGAGVVRGVHMDSVRYLAPAPGDTAAILFFAEGSEATDISAGDDSEGSICVYRPIAAGTDRGEAPSMCVTLAELLAGEAVSQIFKSPNTLTEPEQSWTFGLVPDGVASVSAEFQDGRRKELAVKHNFFEFTERASLEMTGVVGCTTWYDAKGQVVSRQPVWEGESCR